MGSPQQHTTGLITMVGGAWRRPRMKVYDYNQEFGGNYYQPMIQYINKKDIYGPFMKRQDVYLPHSAEVTSAKHNLDDFLKSAYAKQMKELNGTTAKVMNTRMRGQVANTSLTPTRTSRLVRDHYVKMVHRMVLKEVMDLPPLI